MKHHENRNKGSVIMSEMRKNKLTQEWILYAENRQKRPYEFEKKMTKKQTENNTCPFCKGNEQRQYFKIEKKIGV